MKATFISKEKNDVKFTIEFTSEEFEQAQIKAYQASKDKYQINGFRKGKAPRGIRKAGKRSGLYGYLDSSGLPGNRSERL